MNSGPVNCKIVAVAAFPYLIAIKYVNCDGSIPKNEKANSNITLFLFCQIFNIGSFLINNTNANSKKPDVNNLIPTNHCGDRL